MREQAAAMRVLLGMHVMEQVMQLNATREVFPQAVLQDVQLALQLHTAPLALLQQENAQAALMGGNLKIKCASSINAQVQGSIFHHQAVKFAKQDTIAPIKETGTHVREAHIQKQPVRPLVNHAAHLLPAVLEGNAQVTAEEGAPEQIHIVGVTGITE